MRVAAGIVPAGGAAAAGPGRGGRRAGHGLSGAGGPSGVEGRAARRPRRPGLRRRGRAAPGRASMPRRRRIRPWRRNSRPTPSSTTSGWSPIWWRPRPPIRICAAALHALVETTRTTKRALVHGDVSPKNILAGPHGPVFLDAECAWWGDPAFDLAFCLNHLLLKCLWTAGRRRRTSWPASMRWPRAYLAGVDWEPAAAFEVPRRPAAARPVPGPGRRQVAGRVPDRRGRRRTGCAAWPGRCCWTRRTRLAEIRPPGPRS